MRIIPGRMYHISYDGIAKKLGRTVWDLIQVISIHNRPFSSSDGTEGNPRGSHEVRGWVPYITPAWEKDVKAFCLASSRPTGYKWVGNLRLMQEHSNIKEIKPEDLPLYLNSPIVTPKLAEAIRKA